MVCYAILFVLVNYIRKFKNLQPIPWRYFVLLMLVDLVLNLSLGIYYMGYRETALGLLFVKCPIAVSPGFLLVEIVVF